MPSFDQLFEKMPNGKYRERQQPIASDLANQDGSEQPIPMYLDEYFRPLPSAVEIENAWNKGLIVSIKDQVFNGEVFVPTEFPNYLGKVGSRIALP